MKSAWLPITSIVEKPFEDEGYNVGQFWSRAIYFIPLIWHHLIIT